MSSKIYQQVKYTNGALEEDTSALVKPAEQESVDWLHVGAFAWHVEEAHAARLSF